MKREIAEAYDLMKPEEDAKKRMLKNIQLTASEVRLSEKEENMKKSKIKLISKIAVAATVVLLVPTVAYGTNLFGLQEASLGKQQIKLPIEETAGTEQRKQMMEVDIISLQGVADSPEYKACREWMDFLNIYDANGDILSEVGNNATGFEEEYGAYLCYSQEMADKIDEICEKYQLKKLPESSFSDDYKILCGQIGVGDIMGEAPENAYIDNVGGYAYSNGTFQMEGTAVVTGKLGCMMEYQFRRSVKGYFDSTVLNVGNMNDYEQWEYTTVNGETVLLANSSGKALIIAEKENSFIVVNVLGDTSKDSFDVSNEALEELAEMFDFSVIP